MQSNQHGQIPQVKANVPGQPTVSPPAPPTSSSLQGIAPEPKPPTPPELRQTLKVWRRGAVVLHSLYILLGLLATVSALILATFTEDLDNFETKVLALVATGAAGLITAFDIGGKGNAMRKSWRLLNAALISYRDDPAFTHEQLMATY